MSSVAHDINKKENRTVDVVLNRQAAFSKMHLSDKVLKGITNAGFVYPTMIQANSIRLGKAGIDLLIQSKSGTGKTLIFSIIILENYQSDIVQPQALVLVPSRELAVQIVEVINTIGYFCKGFRAVPVIGGIGLIEDRKRLQGAKVVVATPGRAIHLIKNGIFNTSQVKLLVLDEADKLYSQSFRQDILYIQKSLPSQKQTVASSATFCDGLDKEITKVMRNPLFVSTIDNETVLLGLKQYVYDLPEQKTSILEMNAKIAALRYIFRQIPFEQCILFASTQSRAESYCNNLEKDGWLCKLITGAQAQKKRLENFYQFRKFKTRILLATDVWSRGIDSNHVNLVINLEMPGDVVTYLHRIGRAGRFGSQGTVISFVSSESDRNMLKQIVTKCSGVINVFEYFQRDLKVKNFNDNQFEICKTKASISDKAKDEIGLKKADVKEKEKIVDSYSSIDTKTFRINSKNSALNLLDLNLDQIENTACLYQSSSQQLPSSNTIDDASSIAADSMNDVICYDSMHSCNVTKPAIKNLITKSDVRKQDTIEKMPVKIGDIKKVDADNHLDKITDEKVNIFQDFLNFMDDHIKKNVCQPIEDFTLTQNQSKCISDVNPCRLQNQNLNSYGFKFEHILEPHEIPVSRKNENEIARCNGFNEDTSILSLIANENFENDKKEEPLENESNQKIICNKSTFENNDECLSHAQDNECVLFPTLRKRKTKNIDKKLNFEYNISPNQQNLVSNKVNNFTLAKKRWMNIYWKHVIYMQEYLNLSSN